VSLRLPVGFVDSDNGRFRVIAPRLSLQEMTVLLAGPERDGGDVHPGGRGGARRIVLPGGKAVFCRRYLHGGLLRGVLRDLFLVRPERPLRELVVCETARAAGCSVPAVLACGIEDIGPWYRGWIVTEEVEGARPLIEALADADAAARTKILESVKRVIEELHDAGIQHVDLTGHNVLWRPGARPVVIDFDRARLGQPVAYPTRRRAFARLRRSLAKLCPRHGIALGPVDWATLEPRAPV
jgi:hypothetical protein